MNDAGRTNTMSFVMTAKPRSWLARHYYFLPQIIAFFIVAPLCWMAFDRTPPLILHDGSISPHVVYPGQSGVSVTWRAKFSGRDCPGLSQREIVDSRNNLWPQMARVRRGIFVADVDDEFRGVVDTPPLDIPAQIEPGRAYYRVTQFYYCNTLQRFLAWPIVQSSPLIPFEVVAK